MPLCARHSESISKNLSNAHDTETGGLINVSGLSHLGFPRLEPD